MSYAQGVNALKARNLDVAEKRFKEAVAKREYLPEANFYLGCIAILRQDADKATTYLNQYAVAGPVADDFYQTFGGVVQSLGDAGENLRAVLRLNRKLPVQVAVRTTTEPDEVPVEPWFFSASKMHLYPRKNDEFKDLPKLIEQYVLPGYLPEGPVFGPNSTFLTIGSCFADELNKYLAEIGRGSGWVCVPPGLNNTFAVRQFIEWCVTGEQSSDAYWYDEADGGAKKWKPEADRLRYLDNIKSASAFVFTIGLAEVWEDTQTRGTFWRGVPKSLYDPTRHVCRMSTIEENVANLRRIVDLVHGISPDAQIIFTLSPIPLKATFDERSCVTADCVSKSILRVAIDQVTSAGLQKVAYWPSFEIVRWLSGHLPYPMFGDDGNVRHVNRMAVKLILDAFMRHYYKAA